MTDTGRIALITGGNRGLGRASALALADAGTDVLLTYRTNAGEAEQVVADIRAKGRGAVALQLDTEQPDTFEAFATSVRAALGETWQRDTFDGLVNNAGASGDTVLGSTGAAVIDTLMNVHFKGVYLLTQALLPLLSDGGRIVNTSTGLARFVGAPYSVYASMKGAIEVLSRYWAQELGARGITVNVVAPGPIATDFGGGYMRDNDQVRSQLGSLAALGSVGEPEYIGDVVTMLLSDRARWVTGQRVEASGGFRL